MGEKRAKRCSALNAKKSDARLDLREEGQATREPVLKSHLERKYTNTEGAGGG